jgi:hypothetical protein
MHDTLILPCDHYGMEAAMPLQPDLGATLIELAAQMVGALDPWWVIASAAMALHGAPVEVGDVDLLASERDARALLARLGIVALSAPGTDRFRSTVFARWDTLRMPVEVMADFHVRGPAGWQLLVPETRMTIAIDGVLLPVPSIDELIDHCRLYGRPKDSERAALLQRLAAERRRHNPPS